jgi:hypothetical protein
LPGKGPERKEDQLKPSSSIEELEVAVLALALRAVATWPPPCVGAGVGPLLLLLLLLLPEELGGTSGTLGCVPVSDSVLARAATRRDLLLLLLLLLLKWRRASGRLHLLLLQAAAEALIMPAGCCTLGRPAACRMPACISLVCSCLR